MTYRDFGKIALAFGAGLIKLGMAPAPDDADLQTIDGPHTMLIFEETCAPWLISMFGAFSQSIAVATSYATLGISAVVEAINETSARAIVCNIKDVSKIAEACKNACPSLKAIIYTTNYSTEKRATASESKFEIVSFDDVVQL